ncbi:MAG TPA: tetratricopeptide repeat protein [Kofleriaceae bacterium]|jgi:tetratricopeptide (TPR) repeat protein|nr:tetratricopeptide repeat protein [Kofleriaceae bacterium]
MTARASLLLVCTLATTAAADVWQRAIDDASTATRDRYDIALAKGDELALRANARGQAQRKAVQLVDQAIAAYKEAGDLRPDQGEPYYRIATVLESFFIDCDDAYRFGQYIGNAPPLTCSLPGAPADPARMRQTLEAWDTFEARARLDPRLADALFQRAILRTKLVDGGKDSKRHLEGAMRDYLAILDRADGMSNTDVEGVWGNLAETYMMLGKLEQAIDGYRTALRMGAGASTAFGLAVALDRDENYPAAVEVIRRQPPEQVQEFRQAFLQKRVFFVPQGEEFYYFALIHQAYGFNAEALGYWKQFIASGAHPQYQARAKHHLDELQAKVRATPAARRQTFDPFELYP